MTIPPPLRERLLDIELLLERFISQYRQLNKCCFQGLSDGARRFLLNHNYPGNVRELENMIERAVVLAEVERYMIYKTLHEVDSNRTHAAAQLGISIRTLRNKLKEYREKYGDLAENQ